MLYAGKSLGAARSPIFLLCLELGAGQKNKAGKVEWGTLQESKALFLAWQPCPFHPGLVETNVWPLGVPTSPVSCWLTSLSSHRSELL